MGFNFFLLHHYHLPPVYTLFMTQGPFLKALILREPEEEIILGHVNRTILLFEDLYNILTSEINTFIKFYIIL